MNCTGASWENIEICWLQLNSSGISFLWIDSTSRVAPLYLVIPAWLVSQINTRGQNGSFRFVSVFLKTSICLSLAQSISMSLRSSLSVCLSRDQCVFFGLYCSVLPFSDESATGDINLVQSIEGRIVSVPLHSLYSKSDLQGEPLKLTHLFPLRQTVIATI